MTPGDSCFRMRISVQSKAYWEPEESVELSKEHETYKTKDMNE